MQTVILLLGIGVFAVIAYGDVRRRRIPNALAIAVAVLGLVRLMLAADPRAALYTLVAATAIFAVSFLMFWRGWIGGGDAKLLPAATLLVGFHDVPSFLLLMSLCGGVLAIAVLAASKFGGPLGYLLPGAAVVEPPDRPSVPYGVAIALAGVMVLVLQHSVVK